MSNDSVTIRPMVADELETVAALRAAGFGGEPNKVQARLKENPRYTLNDVLVAEQNGQLIGTATLFPAQMWLSGVPLKIAAVAGVTVQPEFREQGVAGQLMRHCVTLAQNQDVAFTVLFPFSHNYYNRFGFGTVGDLHAYRFTPANLNLSGNLSKVRPFSADDLPMMRVVYKGQQPWHNGWFTRSNDWWDEIVTRWKNIVVYEDDELIDGYYVYQYRTGNINERVLEIKEFFAGEPEAYQSLLAHMAAQDNIDVIEYLAPPDTALRHSLHEPVAEGADNRGWIFDDLCYVTAGPMARIINLNEALTKRFYTRGMSGERVLHITDDLIAENEAPLVFRLVDGRAETRPADEGSEPEVKTDIVTLSQILCGYLKSADARRIGRLQASADTCSWLDKIIIDSPLYIQAGDWF